MPPAAGDEGPPRKEHQDALRSRTAAMEHRVLKSAFHLSGSAGARWDVCRRALSAAHTVRMEALSDAHDPDLLHPGRTLLILLQDVGMVEPELLATGALGESRVPELRVPGEEWENELPALGWLRKVEALESAPSGELMEELRRASEGVALIWLSERLDHLRHCHLLPDPVMRAQMASRAVEVELPAARQWHPTLARRLSWWCRRVAPRLVQEGTPESG